MYKENLEIILEEYRSADYSADELAEKWRHNLLDQVEHTLTTRWDSLGIPRPIAFLEESNDTLVTWTHPKFSELSGFDPLTENYFAIVEWLCALNPEEFLIPCACLLALLGAEFIFITEGSGDKGIDCIGRIDHGLFRSLCFFVQAKKSNSIIAREVVLIEFGKYQMLPCTDRYKTYLEKLKIGNSSDGMAIIYMIATNNEFHPSARIVASSLGILLRSRTQLAHMLSSYASLQRFKDILDDLRGFVRPSGSFTNLAPRIKSHLDA